MLIEYSNKIRITEWIRILIRTPPDNLTDLDFISCNIRTDYCIFCVLKLWQILGQIRICLKNWEKMRKGNEVIMCCIFSTKYWVLNWALPKQWSVHAKILNWKYKLETDKEIELTCCDIFRQKYQWRFELLTTNRLWSFLKVWHRIRLFRHSKIILDYIVLNHFLTMSLDPRLSAIHA